MSSTATTAADAAVLSQADKPALGKYANWSRFAAAAAISGALMSSSLPSPLYVQYQQVWGLSNLWVSLLFASYAAGVLGALLLMGKFGDRMSDRRVGMLAGCVFVVLSSLIMAVAPYSWVLLLGRVCSGLGTGLLVGSASAALLELHPTQNTRTAAVHATVAFTLGAALGPVVSGTLLKLDWSPLSLSYVPVGLLALLAAPAIYLTPVPVFRRQKPVKAGQTDTSGESGSREKRRGTIWSFALAVLVLLQSWSIGAVFMASGPRFALDLARVDGVLWAAAVISIFQFMAAGGQILAGRFSQKKAILAGVSISAAALVGIAVTAEFQMPVSFTILVALAGFGYGLSFVGATALVNLVSRPDNRARLVSIYYMFGYLMGNAVPAMAVGALIDSLNLASALNLFTGWVVFLSALLASIALIRQREVFSR